MTTQDSTVWPSDMDVCERVKQLGYHAAKTLKLYGEKYEVVSDPFMDGDKVALHVRTTKQTEIRTLRLPSTILQSALRILNRAS
jgi:hypothetical protein